MFCPNCTLQEHWVGPLARISRQDPTVLETSLLKAGLSSLCCDPLKGKTLRVSYALLEPVAIPPKTKGGKVTGINIDLAKELSSIMGFKCRFINGGFDIKILGKWYGSMAKISRNQVDLGAPVTIVRRSVLGTEASSYTYFDKFVISTRIPIRLKY